MAATKNKSRGFYVLLINFIKLVTFQLLRVLYGDREETQSSLIHPYQTVGKSAKFWSLKGVRFEKCTL